MTFSQIPYERVDTEALKVRIQELTQDLQKAETFEQAEQAFLTMDETLGSNLETMVTVASIRRDIDTRDKFYEAEMEFYDQELPNLQPLQQEWTNALLASPFRKELAAKYGEVPFINAEIAAKAFIPEMVEDLQKENDLCSQYTKLIASAQIPFDGKTLTVSQMTPYKCSTDDKLRHEAWKAEGSWFASKGAELDRIYDEMVKLRDSMGKKLGHKNYIQLGYYRMNRNCYGVEDIEKFRKSVQKYLVPLAKKIYIRQAERMGYEFPMSFADKGLAFRSGNPKPVGTPAEILANGTKFYSELSPETKEFWDHMIRDEMMDVESKPGKASGGYCTGIYGCRSPFIFANFNGTSGDVEVITHEAGHAFEFYLNRNRVPFESAWPSMEACEVHSMSMEFFGEAWADLFFGKDARKFLYTHLSDALTFIPYGTMVDHFQHIVYEYPEFTPEERHQAWRELMGIYMPWVRPDDIPFYGEGKMWQRQSHIYQSPFYYIDYCLAQTVALMFWEKIQEDPKKAFKQYMDYTTLGGSLVFTDLLKQAGLESPFEEDCLRSICTKANEFLENFDLSGIE